MLDQRAALRWVQDNIEAFGGEPAIVTAAFGQSAGAGSIAGLLTTPAATAGLFRRAILQSIPGAYLAPALAADVASEICALLGRTPAVDDLADVAPHDLTSAAATGGPLGRGHRVPVPLRPDGRR